MSEIDSDYHKSLEDTVDHLINLWLEPIDDEVEAEDFKNAEITCRKVFAGIQISGLTPKMQEVIIMDFAGTIAKYRKKVRQESIIARTSLVENKKLRSLLRKNGMIRTTPRKIPWKENKK